MRAGKAIVSAHADYRPGDYHFARTQSRAQSLLEWEHRQDRLRSWSEMLVPALGIVTAAALAFEALL